MYKDGSQIGDFNDMHLYKYIGTWNTLMFVYINFKGVHASLVSKDMVWHSTTILPITICVFDEYFLSQEKPNKVFERLLRIGNKNFTLISNLI